MKFTPIIILIVCIASLQTLVAGPVSEYSVDSLAGIVSELRKSAYEKPIKEWLKINRPAQYAELSGEKQKEQEADPDKSKSSGILSALSELNVAIADSESLMIDYYINAKAKEGWIVVSLTDKMILFRRDPDSQRK